MVSKRKARPTEATGESPDLPTDDLLKNIDTSKLSSDGKEILICLVQFFEKRLKTKDDEVEALTCRVTSLQSRVEKLEDELDATSAYERRDTLVVSGVVPEVREGENCKVVVRDMLKEKTKLSIKLDDISIAHRLGGKSKQQGPDRRSIIVKLCRRDLKTDILYACKEHRPPFYVNENLTPIRNKIMYFLRQLKKKYPSKIHGCRSFNGNVTAFLPLPGSSSAASTERMRTRRVMVNTRRSFEELLRSELSVTLEDIGEEWPANI